MKFSFLLKAAFCCALVAAAPSLAFADAPARQVVSPSVTVFFPSQPEHVGTEALYVARSTSPTDGRTVAYVAAAQPGAMVSWAFSHYPDLITDALTDKLKKEWSTGDGSTLTDITPVEFDGGVGFRFTVDDVVAAPPKPGKKRGMLAAANFFPGQHVRFDGYFLFAKDGPVLLATATPSDTPPDPTLLDKFAQSAQLKLAPKTTDTPEQQEDSIVRLGCVVLLVGFLLFVAAIVGIVLLVKRILRKRTA